MAVTPFVSTGDLYNPFRQAGDAGGMIYGQRKNYLSSGALGPAATSLVPQTQEAGAVSLYSGVEGSRQGDNDGGPQINEYTGDFFSLSPGDPVTRQAAGGVSESDYGKTSSTEGNWRMDQISIGGVLGALLGMATPIPGAAIAGYHGGRMAEEAMFGPKSLNQKTPGTATPQAQPKPPSIGQRQPGDRGSGRVDRNDRGRDDHGGMSRAESDRRGGRQGGYGRSF